MCGRRSHNRTCNEDDDFRNPKDDPEFLSYPVLGKCIPLIRFVFALLCLVLVNTLHTTSGCPSRFHSGYPDHRRGSSLREMIRLEIREVDPTYLILGRPRLSTY